MKPLYSGIFWFYSKKQRLYLEKTVRNMTSAPKNVKLKLE